MNPCFPLNRVLSSLSYVDCSEYMREALTGDAMNVSDKIIDMFRSDARRGKYVNRDRVRSAVRGMLDDSRWGCFQGNIGLVEFLIVDWADATFTRMGRN